MKEKRVENSATAILVSTRNDSDSLEELKQLLSNLDISVRGMVIQPKREPDSRTYLGKGKLAEVKELVESFHPSFVVVDDEITPLQTKNIEKFLQVPVKDRTQIILDIFAKHATTEESILQVELAKLSYELPRLVGEGKDLSRTGGGIGTRGPGEQKLEERRRYIKRRISWIRKKLEEIKRNRDVQRKRRTESAIPMVSLVGYTNAGKSSLLKVLSKSEVPVSERMFSSLSPVIRRVRLPDGRFILLKDTVGFVRNVPHTVIEAFKSTLEEILFSDLIAVVVDLSEENFLEKLRVCVKVLEELSADSIQRIVVFNKIDLLSSSTVDQLRIIYPDAVFLSARTGIGVEDFLKRISSELSSQEVEEVIEIEAEELPLIMKRRDVLTIVQQNCEFGKVSLRLRGRKNILDRIRKMFAGGIK